MRTRVHRPTRNPSHCFRVLKTNRYQPPPTGMLLSWGRVAVLAMTSAFEETKLCSCVHEKKVDFQSYDVPFLIQAFKSNIF